MNIYILTEITKRELDSNLLLACLAANNNFEVLITNSETIRFLNEKKLLKPGIFHTKSLVHGKKKEKLHNSLKNNGIKITSLDEEAGLVQKNLKYFVETRFTNSDLNISDKIFCWGNHDYKTLNVFYKKFKKKFILSGSPRFDMMRSDFKDYWNFKNSNNKKILISGNFNLVNGYINKSKIFYNLEKEGYFKRSPDFKRELSLIINDSEKNFYKFFEMLTKLINNFPSENFLIRPHPLEKTEIWMEKFKNFKNVEISKEGNINEQLINSKILIHNSCTSAFHAHFYRIPIISYEPTKSESSYGDPANELSERTYNIDELIEKVQQKINLVDNSSTNQKKNIFDNKVFISVSKYSSEIILDEWKKICPKVKIKNNWKKINLEMVKKKIINLILKFIINTVKPFKNNYKDRKFEDLDELIIKNKINKIQKILQNTSDLNVKKITDRCFLIKKT